jgi:hypothetical protein
MTTATLRLSTPLPEARTEPARGLFWRIYDAFVEARMRAAMRELRTHRHLIPEDMLKQSGYQATADNDGAYPFTR